MLFMLSTVLGVVIFASAVYCCAAIIEDRGAVVPTKNITLPSNPRPGETLQFDRPTGIPADATSWSVNVDAAGRESHTWTHDPARPVPYFRKKRHPIRAIRAFFAYRFVVFAEACRAGRAKVRSILPT